MSKPTKPGELVNVEVEAISMVSKAANGERFKIFKSAEPDTEQATPESKEDGIIKTALKETFNAEDKPDEKVEKGAVADIYRNKQNIMHLNEAFYALRKVLKLDDDNTETDANKIRDALDDFRNVAGQILLGTETEPIIKAGRKVSGSRLSKLRDIQRLINDVLDGVDEPRDEVIDLAENQGAADIQKAISEALKPLSDKVNNLDVESVVKTALTPIITRIEKIENARGFSNRALDNAQVEKSGGSFWDGAF